MKQSSRWIAGLVALSAATGFVIAGAEAAPRRSSSTGGQTDGPIFDGIDASAMDYLSQGMNGVMEFGFAPGPELSLPPSSQYPRPSELVARIFVSSNAEALGIGQEPDEFILTGTEVRCDGSEVVSFQQTWSNTPVDTSFLRLVVSDQIVRYVEARFVPMVSALPVCQASPPHGNPQRIAYLPTGTSTVVVVTTIDQLTQARVETVWNACTNEVLSVVNHYRW